MKTGMIHRRISSMDYDATCLNCGSTDKIQLFPHRNGCNKMVGMIFLCNDCTGLATETTVIISCIGGVSGSADSVGSDSCSGCNTLKKVLITKDAIIEEREDMIKHIYEAEYGLSCALDNSGVHVPIDGGSACGRCSTDYRAYMECLQQRVREDKRNDGA